MNTYQRFNFPVHVGLDAGKMERSRATSALEACRDGSRDGLIRRRGACEYCATACPIFRDV